MLSKFKSALVSMKNNPIAFSVIILVIVVFGGSMIVGAYQKVRAKVPALPAPK